MEKEQVFYSFEYRKDGWRASQVRKMGNISEESTFSDDDWAAVRLKTDYSIRKWIDAQMKMRSCLVVLIGSTTSTRKWVKYEIEKAYELGKGIVGICIHNLKDYNGVPSSKGINPLDEILAKDGSPLSAHVTCFESSSATSAKVCVDIEENIDKLIAEAIQKSGTY